MAGGGTFRATRGKDSRGAKSRPLHTRTSQTPSSLPTILLQPQCHVSSGTNASISPQIVSQTPHESATVVEVGESSTQTANIGLILLSKLLFLVDAIINCIYLFFIEQDSPQQPRAPRGAYLNKI